ncbi:MAG: hypothetical protein KY462_03230 [Actinobacteria bacterium]|nr:hypothetical protein [Actinomycetota bacterium]
MEHDPTAHTHILVRGTKTGLPYSKGLLATSVQATGLAPARAYGVAERVENVLRDSGTREVSVEELRQVAVQVLRDTVSEKAADRYLRWQRAQERQLPLIVLIGGATGVGKSTVATHLASRLAMTRIVSTDAIREVMRSTISEELMPSLHVSSFEAVDAVPPAVSVVKEPLIAGFLRQVQAVSVGIRHLVERDALERTDMIVEGVHILPGMITASQVEDAAVVQVVLTVDDSDVHRSHLSGRSQQAPDRPRERYLERFEEIREIQDEVVRRAEAAGVPMVRSYALDATVDEVHGLVVDAVLQRQGEAIPDVTATPRGEVLSGARGDAGRRG